MENSAPIVQTAGNVADAKIGKNQESTKNDGDASLGSKESGSKDIESKGSVDYSNTRQFVRSVRDVFQISQELQSVERLVKDKESLMLLKDFVSNKYSNTEDAAPKTALSQLSQVLAPIESEFLDTATEADIFEYTDELRSYLDDL